MEKNKTRVVYRLKQGDRWNADSPYVVMWDEAVRRWRVCRICWSEEQECLNGTTMRYELEDTEYTFANKTDAENQALAENREWYQTMADLIGGMN